MPGTEGPGMMMPSLAPQKVSRMTWYSSDAGWCCRCCWVLSVKGSLLVPGWPSVNNCRVFAHIQWLGNRGCNHYKCDILFLGKDRIVTVTESDNLPPMYECVCYSRYLPKPGIVNLFYFSHSGGYVEVSHWCFNLHFSDDQSRWSHFKFSLAILTSYLWAVSLNILLRFLLGCFYL